MALIEEMDNTGNWLFQRRSYLPIVMYLFGALVLYLEPESNFVLPTSLTWGLICLGVSFIGIVIRAIVIGYIPKATSGRNTSGQVAETVNTRGIYSIVRHPLYLGNFFMWLGIILYVGNVWFCIVSCLLFWLYYERIMFAEEIFMQKKFGERYGEWAKDVPPFFPKFKRYKRSKMSFSLKNVLKREYSGFLALFVSFFLLNFLKNYFQTGQVLIQSIWSILLVIAIFITLIIKFLRTKGILDVSGR